MQITDVLNQFSARNTGRTAYTIFSILQRDPNTTEEQLLELLEGYFGSEATLGWFDAKLKQLFPAMPSQTKLC